MADYLTNDYLITSLLLLLFFLPLLFLLLFLLFLILFHCVVGISLDFDLRRDLLPFLYSLEHSLCQVNCTVPPHYLHCFVVVYFCFCFYHVSSLHYLHHHNHHMLLPQHCYYCPCDFYSPFRRADQHCMASLCHYVVSLLLQQISTSQHGCEWILFSTHTLSAHPLLSEDFLGRTPRLLLSSMIHSPLYSLVLYVSKRHFATPLYVRHSPSQKVQSHVLILQDFSRLKPHQWMIGV